jgi:Zn-dependent protease with chaperone function
MQTQNYDYAQHQLPVPPMNGLHQAPAQSLLTTEPDLPTLSYPQGSVDLTAQVAPFSGPLTIIGYVVVAIGGLVGIVATGGMLLAALIASPIAEWFRWRKVRAMIRGSGIHVSAEQMPFLHRMVTDFSRRLGMKKIPEVYIVEDGMQNGMAFKLGTKDIIILTDDVVWGALGSKDPKALGFVVGHEIAHIAHGHTKTLRNMVSTFIKPLAKLDEYTADNTATALVGDTRVAAHGLTVLTVGPQLLRFLNDEALFAQAREVAADKQAKKAERTMGHPLLLKRINNVLTRPV